MDARLRSHSARATSHPPYAMSTEITSLDKGQYT
jgi:hypothetical protein